MDETEIKHVVEAALLGAGRPLTLDDLGELFATKGDAPEKATLKRVLESLRNEYQSRGIEIKEVASGYRVQIRRTMTDWLQPLWEERAPRYTRALLETLALVAYRQPITRAEIEEVRGVVVSTNIIRTLLERNWIRVVGHRDVPGKPAMFGTTKEFLDYFGLKKLDELPTLAEIKDGFPELSPQTDLLETLEAGSRVATASQDADLIAATASAALIEATLGEDDENADLGVSDESDEEASDADSDAAGDDDADGHSAEVIPLRAADEQ
jgi:segregation and condensation protein B